MATTGSRPASEPDPDGSHEPSASGETPSAPPGSQPDGRLAAARRWLALTRPASVWAVAAALALEGLGLVACAVLGIVRLLPGQDHVVSVSVALTVFSAAGAWLLLACAVGAGSGHAWVRGPALTVQVLLVLVGVSLLQAGVVALGLGAVVVGLGVLVGLLSAPVSRFTGRRTYSLDQD